MGGGAMILRYPHLPPGSDGPATNPRAGWLVSKRVEAGDVKITGDYIQAASFRSRV